ncbi:MAG: M28 family peptidase [Thermoanaerobaculia bacterium]
MDETKIKRPIVPVAVAAAWGGLLVLGLAAYLAIAAAGPPAASPATAPPDQFSALRAERHVRALAGEPRAVGSVGHRLARDYLLGQLAELGLTPERQRATVLRRSSSGLIVGALVENLLARRPGTRPGRALALIAHYDTRPTTPGAGDDASGVAVVLETLRALGHGAPFDNDLIVLFTDAEELGLMGARAFIDEHPWAREVGLVINFEARGNRGVASMFETGRGNERLIREFGRSAPYPFASSLSQEFYRRMPNDTDFSVFKRAGISGLNFAFISGHPAYHTRLDTPARLDLRSLQHEGSNALALVRHLGRLDLDELAGEDAIYFNPWGWRFVVYPQRWAVALAVAGGALLMLTLAFGLSRRAFSVRELVAALGQFALSLVLAPLLVALVWRLFAALFPALLQTPYRVPYDHGLCALAFVLLAVGVTATLIGSRARGGSAFGVAGGVLSGWALLALLSAFLLPGASYLFAWPTVGGALALALAVAITRGGTGASTAALWTLGGVPGVVLVAPLVPVMFEALTLRGGALVIGWVTLLVGLALPLLAILGGRATRRLGFAAFALALVLFAAVVLRSGFDRERPRADSLFYALDTDSGAAVWCSQDQEADPWTRLRLGEEAASKPPPEFLGLQTSELFQGPAPALELPPPALEVLADDRRQGRRVEVEVTSPRGAPLLRLHAESTVPILAFRLNDQRIEIDGSGEPLQALIAGVPEEGVRLGFELTDRWPVELGLIDQSYGLPVIPGRSFQPRPDWIVPSPSWLNHTTLVYKSYLF